MRFIPLLYRYKYRIFVSIFIVTALFVGIFWCSLSGTILLNIAIPFEAMIFTLIISIIIEHQNSDFEYRYQLFRLCRSIETLTLIKHRDALVGSHLIISQGNEVMHENINVLKQWYPKTWNRFLLRNIERKIGIFESKILAIIDKKMPIRLKSALTEKMKKDKRYPNILYVVTEFGSVYDSIHSILSYKTTKTDDNTFLAYEIPYFSESVDLESKNAELNEFCKDSKFMAIVNQYKSFVVRYARVSMRHIKWFHKLYDGQMFNSVSLSSQLDELYEKVKIDFSLIEDHFQEQVERIIEAVDSNKDEIEQAINALSDDVADIAEDKSL